MYTLCIHYVYVESTSFLKKPVDFLEARLAGPAGRTASGIRYVEFDVVLALPIRELVLDAGIVAVRKVRDLAVAVADHGSAAQDEVAEPVLFVGHRPGHAQLVAVDFGGADDVDLALGELAVETVERLLDALEDRLWPLQLAAERIRLHVVESIVVEVLGEPRPVVVDVGLLEITGVRQKAL